MRKHFLILMLMALLPLAGFAATLPADIVVTAPNRTYTGDPYVGYGISSATDDGIDAKVVARFYSDANCETEIATPTHAGTYYLRYEGDGTNYDNDSYSEVKTFKINQVVLIYMLANKTQVYDGNPVTTGGMYALNSGDFVNTETLDGLGITFSLPGAPLVNVSQSGASYTTLDINYNGNVDYNIQFTGTSIVTITPKDLSEATAADPTWATPEDQTWDGTAKEPTPGALTLAGYDFNYDAEHNTGDYTVAYSYNTNVVTMEGSVEKHPTITYTATEGGNFTGSVTKEFVINKANIVPADYIAPTKKTGLTYNGTAQALLNEGSLVNNYGTILYLPGNSTEVPEKTDAGDYTVKWRIIGDDNHNNISWKELGEAQIGKAPASIISPNKTVTYSGDATVALPNLDELTFFGFTPADEATVKDAVHFEAIAAENKVAGTHANAIEVDEGTYPASITANYIITQGKGTLTVEKKLLKVKARSKTKKYGEADAEATFDDGVASDATYNLELASGDDAATVFADEDPTPVVVERGEGEDIDEYVLSISGGALTVAGAKNYTLDATSYVPGKFTIVANPAIVVTLYAANVNKTYGDAIKTFETIVKGTDYAVTGLVDDADLSTDALEITCTVAEDNQDAGTYPITIGLKSGKTVADLLPSTKYDLTKVQFIPGTYTIAQKPLTFTVDAQTMQQGSPVNATTFNTSSFKANGILESENKDDIFELSIDPSLTTTVGDVLKIKDDAATSLTGIIVKVKDGADEKAANYSYNFALETNKGTLNIINGTILFLNDDSELLAKMTTANGDPEAATPVPAYGGYVKFGARKFTAEQWNTMVLPFDIAVEDLSANFGYCIVNILNETTTDNNIKFKFHMQGIPANTPFLIKFADDVQMSNATINLATLKKVDADDMSVDRTTTGVTFNYDADDAAENAYFKGVYEHQNIQGKNYGVLCDHEVVAGAERTGWKSFSSVAYDLAPFRAYLVYAPVTNNTSTAPMITVEDENGTTAIMSVTSDGRLIEAEGWYTLNGVKLQGVPTEKGIYIHNGKKLVVK